MFNDFFSQGKTPKNNVCIQKTHKFTFVSIPTNYLISYSIRITVLTTCCFAAKHDIRHLLFKSIICLHLMSEVHHVAKRGVLGGEVFRQTHSRSRVSLWWYERSHIMWRPHGPLLWPWKRVQHTQTHTHMHTLSIYPHAVTSDTASLLLPPCKEGKSIHFTKMPCESERLSTRTEVSVYMETEC